MIRYSKGTPMSALTSDFLDELKKNSGIEIVHHVEPKEGYTNVYTMGMVDKRGIFAEDFNAGREAAETVQKGFRQAGYEEDRIKVGYRLERMAYHTGTSPKLEFQVDTNLTPEELRKAVEEVRPLVAVSAGIIDKYAGEPQMIGH